MKNMFIQVKKLIFLLSIFELINNIYISDVNDMSFKEALNQKHPYDKSNIRTNNNNILNYEPQQTKLFFSENKNKYYQLHEISNSSIDYKDIINNSSFYEIPEILISQYERKYQREKISKIIRNIERNKNKIKNKNNYNSIKSNRNNNYMNNNINKNNNNYEIKNEYFSDEYNFYGNKKLLSLDYNYYWHKLISKNSIINELSSSPIKELISTEPEQIYIEQKICFPVTKLIYINNPDIEDNLLIKDIKSDLHQVKIFPYLSDEYIKTKGRLYTSINSYFPYSIFPQSKFVFQLLILPDVIGKITGNLYIKFNDKKVLIIPITIIGKENEYKIKPIYYMNWQINKKLILPVKVTNPSKKKLLIVKDIIHSFKKIAFEWPDGVSLSDNNYTSFSPSMLHVWPKESKTIFHLKIFSETVTSEYGFIHLKIDDNIIVIPVLINIKKYSLNTFPGFINFGLCDLSSYNRRNFVKMVPLLIMNYGNEDIEIKRVYIDYEDKFIHFQKSSKNENRKQIIVKKNTHNQFGYIIFDGKFAVDKDEKKYNGKIQRGCIYIETNSTINPLLEIEYFYLTDYNKIIKVISGDVQNITNKDAAYNFNLLFQYRPPPSFEISLNNFAENMTIYKDNYYTAILSKISKNNEKYLFKINFDMKHLDIMYYRYIYVPFKISTRLYTIIPIEIDNNNIDIAFCNSYSDDISFPLCIKNYGGFNRYNSFKVQYLLISTQFRFGSVTGGINRKKYVYIINDNLYPIQISSIETNNLYFTLDLEKYYSIDRNKSLIKYDYSLKGKLPGIITNNVQKTKNKNSCLNITIYPKTALLLSININSKNIKNKTLLEGDIYLSFNTKSGITISNKVSVLIGDFSISPSNIKFEPAFPGIVQNKIIFCKNTYQLPLDIISVSSTDDRIIPILLTDKVAPGNKTSIIKIVFKPDTNSLIKDSITELDMEKSLTYRELYLWKKNEEYWNDLGQNGKTEINANITVVTSLKTKIINVRSFLIKPNLIKKEEIDYGLVQIGQLEEKNIEVYNPSDSILEMKLFLAPDYYNDINNYSMFNLKDQQELYLDKNSVVLMLGCTFVINQNNSYKNVFEYIIINENINLDNYSSNQMAKEKLLKKLFFYGNAKVKKYLQNSINVLCSYEKKYKNIFSIKNNEENRQLMSIFSSDFNNEIEIIKNLTNNEKYNTNLTTHNSGGIWTFFSKILSKILNHFIFTKEYFPNVQLQEIKQSFYLQENLPKRTYRIPPHQKIRVGPIIFKPNNTGRVANTLFLKNNLTILYPIKLKGEGGSGQITFINYYKNMKSKKTDIFNNTNFIIEINSDIYENKMKFQNNIIRTITINNSGNLPLVIKNVTIDNNECQTDDLKIIQCKEFLLDTGESIDINMEISINFGNYITNRVVTFNTEYQSFKLNVIIIISKELYEQKIFYWKISKIFSFIVIPFVISVIILKKIFSFNKDLKKKAIESGKINGSNNLIENRQINNNEKINQKESDIKKNYGKKKGKNKKNKKIEKNDKSEKENIIKKIDNSSIDKYFKKSDNSETDKKEKPEILNKNKTFGVIRLNKDNIQNNNIIEKEKKEISTIINNKSENNKKINERSESKDITNKKKNYKKNNENKIEEKKINNNNKEAKNEIIEHKDNINEKNNYINNNINNNINNIINSNNNISNNINIKININLNSKVEDNYNDENKKTAELNTNNKILSTNIVHNNAQNNNNSNYNYNIKLNNNNNSKTNTNTNRNNTIKMRNKTKPTSKKNHKVKKVSNLNELLGITPKKKLEITSKDTSKDTSTDELKKIGVKEEEENNNNNNINNYEEDENKNNNIINKNEEEEQKSKINLNNLDTSKSDIDNKDNENDLEKKENDYNEDDFDDIFASNDFFNSMFENGNNEGEDDVKYNDEDEDLNKFNFIGKQLLNSLFEKPFCNTEKKGNLDELLK